MRSPYIQYPHYPRPVKPATPEAAPSPRPVIANDSLTLSAATRLTLEELHATPMSSKPETRGLVNVLKRFSRLITGIGHVHTHCA